jgi:hypothetical protein
MARQNRRWGYTRIRGALWNLGHDVGRTTIGNILNEHGIEPAPEHRKTMTWAEFLRAHWDVFAASHGGRVDSLQVGHGLRLLRHRTCDAAGADRGHHDESERRMDDAGRSPSDRPHRRLLGGHALPDPRSGQEVLESVPPRPRGCRHRRRQAILSFTTPERPREAIRAVHQGGVLGRTIFFGGRSLRRAIREYPEHYHEERNHQAVPGKATTSRCSAAIFRVPVRRLC